MEIERKFWMDKAPSGLPVLEQAVVYQGYLTTKPTVRIRSKDAWGETSYRLCIKGGGTLARTEVEVDLTAAQFEELRALLTKPMIRKDYTVFSLPGGLHLEYSVVDAGAPTSFCYAEVEFSSIEEARAFSPPAFLGRELTEEPGWSMASYWNKQAPFSGK